MSQQRRSQTHVPSYLWEQAVIGSDKVNEPTSEENAIRSQPFELLRAECYGEVFIYLMQCPHIAGRPFGSLHSDAAEAPPGAEPWHAENAIFLLLQAHAYHGVAELVHVAIPTA